MALACGEGLVMPAPLTPSIDYWSPIKLLNMLDLLSPGLTALSPNQVELSAPKVMIPPDFESENYPTRVFEIWAI